MPLTEYEREKYKRQMMLRGFGPEAQEKLRGSAALVTRCGGLGGPIALYLACAGIGKLVVAHAGETTPSNLNRQILQRADCVGRPRVESIERTLTEMNPDVEIVPVGEYLNSLDAARPWVEQVDIVCDATPDFTERYALNDAAIELGKPVVEAAMNAMEAHLTVLVPGKTPMLRDIYPDAPPSWQVYGFPVLGALSGSLGCLAAIETIKMLTGWGRPLVGRMLVYDAEINLYKTVQLARND